MQELEPLLKPLTRHARQKSYPKGQIILYAGDSNDEALILRSGIVKLHDIDNDGNEKILHLLQPTSVLPLAFFSGENVPMRWFYSALTDCECYVLSASELRATMRASGDLGSALMTWFSLEVHELLERLSSLGKSNTHDKIGAVLKFLAVHHTTARRSGWLRVRFPVSHQLLADMTGITRESTTLAMEELHKNGTIRNPRLTMLEINPDKLFV